MKIVRLVAQWRLSRGILEQTEAFLQGFHELIPPEALVAFDERELEVAILCFLFFFFSLKCLDPSIRPSIHSSIYSSIYLIIYIYVFIYLFLYFLLSLLFCPITSWYNVITCSITFSFFWLVWLSSMLTSGGHILSTEITTSKASKSFGFGRYVYKAGSLFMLQNHENDHINL